MGTKQKDRMNPHLEAEIDSLKDLNSQVIDSIGSFILIVNEDGDIVICNSAARRLTTRRSLEGKSLHEVMKKLGIEWVATALSDVIRTGKPFQVVDTTCKTERREPAVMNIGIYPCNFQVGNTQHAILVMDDVTEQKALEKRLKRLEKSASIGRLSANLAHELGNPLDGTLRYLKLLLDQMPEADPKREYAEYARDGLMRMANMVRGLLDFARKSSLISYPSLIPYPTDIPESIRQILSSFDAQLSEQNIEVTTEFGEDIPVVLNMDVEQIFTNIIKNAIQAMPNGGTLSVDIRMASPRLLEAWFSNTGPGVPDDIRDRIFEPFFTTKGFGQGIGLGLSISQEIAENYNGSIEIESEPDKGTIFIVRLPIGENGLTIYKAESYVTQY